MGVAEVTREEILEVIKEIDKELWKGDPAVSWNRDGLDIKEDSLLLRDLDYHNIEVTRLLIDLEHHFGIDLNNDLATRLLIVYPLSTDVVEGSKISDIINIVQEALSQNN